MANAGVTAILIKIAAIGLKPLHLGKSIAQMYPYLCKMVRQEEKKGGALTLCLKISLN